MQKYTDVVQNRLGLVVEGAKVRVTDINGAVATIFSNNGTNQQSNPMTTDANGRFAFYAADGRYNLTVTINNVQYGEQRDIILNDPADPSPEKIDGGVIVNSQVNESEVNDCTITGGTAQQVTVISSTISQSELDGVTIDGLPPMTVGGQEYQNLVKEDQQLTAQSREALRRSYAEAGYTLVAGNFEEGGTLTSANDVMITASGYGYSWGGSEFPHDVAEDTDPTAAGSSYIHRSSNQLRSDLAPADSVVSIGESTAGHVGKIARITFKSVSDMKAATNLLAGDVVSTGLGSWRIVSGAIYNFLPLLNGLQAIPANGVWLDDWLVDTTGSAPCDAAFNEANTLQRPIMLGVGRYRVNATINLLAGTTIKGCSEHSVIDARMTDVLFRFPTNTGRNVKVFRDFHIWSSGSEMDANGCAFLFPGTPANGAATFTSGYKFENIEIGASGTFGCGFDVCDSFRLTIRDCGMTGVTNPIRLSGNVVQCVIDGVTCNNIDYIRSYKGLNVGVSMLYRSDYSDGMLRGPENAKIMNSSFVVHRRGAITAGLATRIENCDFDFIRDCGIEHGGGMGVEYVGGWIADSNTNNEFVGIRIMKQGDYDDVHVRGVTISTYGIFATKHTAVQIGAGAASPFTEPNGVVVEDMHIIGIDGSWDFGIQADRNVHVVINKNFIKKGTIKATGKAINATYSRTIVCCANVCGNQEIHIEVPDVQGTATVTDNQANVTIANMEPPAGNIEIARNRSW